MPKSRRFRRSKSAKRTRRGGVSTRGTQGSKTTTVKQARIDLFTNKEAPLAFRQYLRNFAITIVKPQNYAYSDEQWLNDHLWNECGKMVRKDILGCVHGHAVEIVDPTYDWTYNQLKGAMGTCSQWSGHTGYCWEGTFDDNRQAAPGGVIKKPQGKYLSEYLAANPK
jgi:hypothetical protein